MQLCWRHLAHSHGTGELCEARALGNRGDTIYIRDDVIERFDTAGRFLGGFRLPEFNPRAAFSIRVVPDGIALLSTRSVFLTSGVAADTNIIQVYRWKSQSVDSPIARAVKPKIAIGNTSGLPPMSIGESLAVTDSGVMFKSLRSGFNIIVIDPRGIPVKRITAHVRPVPLSASDENDDLETRISILTRAAGPNTRIDREKYARELHSRIQDQTRPAIGAIVPTQDGGLLIQRYDISDHPFSHNEHNEILWTLLDKFFTAKGNIRLPRRFDPVVVRGCSVIGVYKDEDNVASVRRYRVSMTGPGGEWKCD
jgi:hypothetical protein